MTKIAPTYLAQLQADPEQTVAVIIKSTTDPQAKANQISAAGLTVTNTFKLISAIAANGPASAVIKLASEP